MTEWSPASFLRAEPGEAELRAKAMLAFLTVTLTAGGAGLFLTGPAAELFGARQVIELI